MTVACGYITQTSHVTIYATLVCVLTRWACFHVDLDIPLRISLLNTCGELCFACVLVVLLAPFVNWSCHSVKVLCSDSIDCFKENLDVTNCEKEIVRQLNKHLSLLLNGKMLYFLSFSYYTISQTYYVLDESD